MPEASQSGADASVPAPSHAGADASLSPAAAADGVFEGGGVKGLAFAGALAAAEDAGVGRWVNVAGTSAGAIVAALLAVGYDARELREVLEETDYRRFADFGRGGRLLGAASNALRLRGLTPGRYFLEWLGDRFADKLGNREPTFADVAREDLPEELGVEERERAMYRLRVVASDVTSGRMLVLPDDLEEYEHENGRPYVREDFPLAWAVRMSMSYPFFFDPVCLYRHGRPHYVIDGGLLSNFPVWLFDSPNPRRPTWGFQLHAGSGPEAPPYRDVPRPFWPLPLAKAMFTAATEAWDRRNMAAATLVRTVSIPTGSVRTMQFELSAEDVEELYRSGYEEARRFFLAQREYMNSFGPRPEAGAPGSAAGAPGPQGGASRPEVAELGG